MSLDKTAAKAGGGHARDADGRFTDSRKDARSPRPSDKPSTSAGGDRAPRGNGASSPKGPGHKGPKSH